MSKCPSCKLLLKRKIVNKYEDVHLGIPGVFIFNTVILESCPECPKSQSVIIPNLQGLIAAVAVYRAMVPFKLSGQEVYFLRKAIEWTAQELAEKLGVRPETISRWENDKEPIGPANEKLLRLIVGQELWSKAPLIDFDAKAIVKMKIKAFRNRPLTMCFENVEDADHQEGWKQKAA